MNIKVKSISLKVGLLYIFLAIVNMSFFSIMIYENQIDLITENTKYNVKELTSMLISSLQKFSDEMKSNRLFNVKNKDEVIREVTNIISKNVHDYVLFTEDGRTLFKSNSDFSVTKSDVLNGIRAVTNMDFTGKQFYSKIDEESNEISFYIPFKVYLLEESILFLKFKMKDIGERLSDLYRLILVIIITIAVFHIIFAVILFRLFVKPIQSLHEKSIEISEGNLSARADIKQDDEIGQLGGAFNSMADSIQEKITTLQKQNEMIEFELNIAGEVQQVIFPKLESTERFDYALYHNAFGKVSGDYYDVIPLRNSQLGFLIVDVSGHGVPAALITMIIKEIFRSQAPYYKTPSQLLQQVNSEITDLMEMQDSHMGIYFSAFYLIIDENNMLSYCNAGHLHSLLIRKNQKKVVTLNTDGFLLGISKDMNQIYETKMTRIESGDKIVMYTDGIVEAFNLDKEQFGVNRILESIRKSYVLSGNHIVKNIVEDLSKFTNIEELKDDATIFLIEVK
ncbi:MAG: SpoIIE family protein phosphatase [Spirochaetota bacterium]|nr:SpoIIE family protein phosphatase [Spirochaetota bacterium]